MENYKLKKYITLFKSIYKNRKKNYKNWWYWKFHQHKRPISIKNIDINKVVVSNKVFLEKKDLNISLSTKMLKKLDIYVYFSKNECI